MKSNTPDRAAITLSKRSASNGLLLACLLSSVLCPLSSLAQVPRATDTITVGTKLVLPAKADPGTPTAQELWLSTTTTGVLKYRTIAGTTLTLATTADLAAFTGTSNIVTLGTIVTGTWSATAIAADKGGTGQTSYTTGDLLYASSSSALSKLAAVATGRVLASAGSGTAPAWSANPTLTGLTLDTGGSNLGIVMGRTTADAAEKATALLLRNWFSAEEPFALIGGQTTSTISAVWIGGGFTNQNASTSINFFTAADNVTLQGSNRMTITTAGVVSVLTTTDSTSSTSGSLITAGGVGIAKALTVGGIAGFGASPTASVRLILSGSGLTTGTTQFGIQNSFTAGSDATVAMVGYSSAISTPAASFTQTDLIHFRASQGTIGVGSTVTNQTGFSALSTLTGGTNNYGFRGSLAAASGRWNLYMDGTAANYLAGELLIGSASDAGAFALQVTGAAIFSSTIQTNGGSAFAITAVNSVSPTAPNRTVTFSYGGTTYYIAAKTTND